MIGLKARYILWAFFLLNDQIVSYVMSTAKLLLTVSPDSLSQDSKATVSCKMVDSVNFYFITLRRDGKHLAMYAYKNSERSRMGAWQKRNVELDYDKVTKTFSASFRVKNSDNGKITCAVQNADYPSNDDPSISVPFLVQKRPELKSLSFIETKSMINKTTFLEDSEVKVDCKVDMGYPLARLSLYKNGESIGGYQGLLQPGENHYNISEITSVLKLSSNDNGASVECRGSNSLGLDRRMRQIHVLYKVRNLKFPYDQGHQLQVGTKLTCAARGNPVPRVNLTVVAQGNATHNADGSPPSWTVNSSFGKGEVVKLIPETAPIGQYGIICEARNMVNGKWHVQKSELVAVNVTGVQTASMNLILGVSIPAGLFVLLILFCCCRSYRRKKKDREAEEEALSYQPKVIQVSDHHNRRRPHYRDELPVHSMEPGTSQATEQLLSTGRDRKDDGLNSSSTRYAAEPAKTVWSEVSAFTACDTKWVCERQRLPACLI